jgi:signal transduction histidine kinase
MSGGPTGGVLPGADPRVGPAERNAKLQARIVDDLLDLSRAITGKLRLNLRLITLDPVIHAAIDSVRPVANPVVTALLAR